MAHLYAEHCGAQSLSANQMSAHEVELLRDWTILADETMWLILYWHAEVNVAGEEATYDSATNFAQGIEAVLGHKFTGLDLGELFAKVACARSVEFPGLKPTLRKGPWAAERICLLTPCIWGCVLKTDGCCLTHRLLLKGIFDAMPLIVQGLDLPRLASASNAFTYYLTPDEPGKDWAAGLLDRVGDFTRLTLLQKAAILEYVRIY